MRIIYDNELKILIPKAETNLNSFLELITNEINRESNYHFIIDFSNRNNLNIQDILLLLTLSKSLRNNKISFVIISSNINLDNVPEDLVIVPSLTEAKDVIEMEKIERDLGF